MEHVTVPNSFDSEIDKDVTFRVLHYVITITAENNRKMPEHKIHYHVLQNLGFYLLNCFMNLIKPKRVYCISM